MRSTLPALALLLVLLAASPAPAASEHQRTRLWLNDVLAPAELLRGRALIFTPHAAFERTNRDASPTAHFDVAVSPTCQADVGVSGRGVATLASARRQVLAGTGFTEAVIGEDRRRDRPWRLIENRRLDENYEWTGEYFQLGLVALRVERRRWLHIRPYAYYDATCTEQERRKGAGAKGLLHLLRTAREQARVVKR